MLKYTERGVLRGARFEFNDWLELPNKSNECCELIMNPSLPCGLNKFEEGGNCFNVFKGFEYQKPEGGFVSEVMSLEELALIQPWLDLQQDLVGGDPNVTTEECVAYSTCWQASIIQRPFRKTGVAIIFKGGYGDGKDVFFDEGVGSIIGMKGGYMVSNNIGEDVLGDFNGAMAAKILIKGEELSFGDVTGNRKEEKFKTYITCDMVQVNEKNEKRISIQDFCNYAFTTNNAVPAAISSGDRRFCIFKSKGVKRSWDEWGVIRSHFAKREFKEALAKYLYTFPIPSGWSPKDNRPQTSSYDYAILANAPAHAKALDAICAMEKTSYEFSLPDVTYEEGVLLLKPAALLRLINEQCGGGGAKGARYGQINLNHALKEEYGMDLVSTAHKKEIVYPPICIVRNSTNLIRIDVPAMVELLKSKGWHEELR